MDERRLEIVEQVLTCTSCDLHNRCKAPVAFRGPKARIAIIGEAPGETEDQLGQPFMGPSGKLLAELLAEVGLTEDYAYINTVSCAPGAAPSWDEVDACEKNKWDQIDWVDPTYVLLLGRVALKGMRRGLDLKARARPFLVRGRWCFSTYHPAAALRNHNFEEAMRYDLDVFKTMVELNDPERFMPANCAACAEFAEWWEADSTLGWCPKHIPEAERAAFEANQKRVAAANETTASLVWQREMRTAAEVRRDVGLARVEGAADPDWKAEAWRCLVEYLHTHREFFVDDFWDSGVTFPRESRALGPLVLQAARQGLMRKTDRYRKSVRSNMTEKPCWESLVYEVPSSA